MRDLYEEGYACAKKMFEEKQNYFTGTFIKYYKISQLIHTQSIAN